MDLKGKPGEVVWLPKIVCLDFDGVIHSYTSGWRGPRTIPDPPVHGAIPWIMGFIQDYVGLGRRSYLGWELHIFSARSRHFGARKAMKRWLAYWGLAREYIQALRFPKSKPPAIVTIDDRCWRFNGVFPEYYTVADFKPWHEDDRFNEQIRLAERAFERKRYQNRKQETSPSTGAEKGKVFI